MFCPQSETARNTKLDGSGLPNIFRLDGQVPFHESCQGSTRLRNAMHRKLSLKAGFNCKLGTLKSFCLAESAAMNLDAGSNGTAYSTCTASETRVYRFVVSFAIASCFLLQSTGQQAPSAQICTFMTPLPRQRVFSATTVKLVWTLGAITQQHNNGQQ